MLRSAPIPLAEGRRP